jgi:hypothetical protein
MNKSHLLFLLLGIALGALFMRFALPFMATPTTVTKSRVSDDSPYLIGVPPAPLFEPLEAIFDTTENSGCQKATEPIIGYIISYTQDKEYCDYELIVQTEGGVKMKCVIDKTPVNNDLTLTKLLSPGNKVEIEVDYCGSAGVNYLTKIKTLERLDLPPAPTYENIELEIFNPGHIEIQETSETITGYVINSFQATSGCIYELLLQEENGTRRLFCIESLSLAEESWIPHILIPGNKVELQLKYATGKSKKAYIGKLKNLKR